MVRAGTKSDLKMMMGIRIITIVTVAILTVGCTSQETWDARRAMPEEVQRNAYAECSKELRLTHWLHLNKLKSKDGLIHVLGSDGSGVIVAEAHQLNLCAWEKLDEMNAANAQAES